MEVSTTLMGLLLLALFMGPILYIIIRNKSKEKTTTGIFKNRSLTSNAIRCLRNYEAHSHRP